MARIRRKRTQTYREYDQETTTFIVTDLILCLTAIGDHQLTNCFLGFKHYLQLEINRFVYKIFAKSDSDFAISNSSNLYKRLNSRKY
jgi:hypothetical protein